MTAKDPAAVSLGRRGGKAAAGKGLRKWRESTTPEQRSELARSAAKARWVYELTFYGAALAPWFPRYRRWHDSMESAQQTAATVRSRMEERNVSPDAHPAIVFGPGCGADGRRIW